jgi:hypothetical protein
MTDCGHACCAIADNAYHSHTAAPDDCDHCVEARTDIDDLSDIVVTVVDRVAPQIPGLPTDADALVEHVIAVTAEVHQHARADPDMELLSPRRRRTVLAARVGLVLAFPGQFPWGSSA